MQHQGTEWVGWKRLLAATLLVAGGGAALAADYSPYANVEHPTRVLWGDTHLHTTNSLDARLLGVTLGVADAYRFARGEQVVASSGQPARLSRPLDFLVVTDHSDLLGMVDQLLLGNPALLENAELREVHEKVQAGGEDAAEAMALVAGALDGDYEGPLLDAALMGSIWERYVETADRFNEPGRFTALIGYEWTPTNSGDKLHRNVLYRDGGDKAGQVFPFTANDSLNPQDLWAWMQRYENETGGRVLALAHNGNLSNGQMFPVETNPNTGAAIDADYVTTRARWEPLYEVTQIKGDGEAHPYLSPEDEFADFETWDRGNVTLEILKTPDMLQYEYAREALKNGLKLGRQLGTNPYQFGMVGSTDSHTALSTGEESNFFGKFSQVEPSASRVTEPMMEFDGRRMWEILETGASGYAAVWAKENTREAIWDAMRRKEVYATTGPRMTVRFFGGWAFSEADASLQSLAGAGYAKGVPMGGTLHAAPEGGAPTFLVAALKDPHSGNLDRIQIVKGWLDASGATHERVFNVAWGDAHRRQRVEGKLPPVGNTVNLADATWTNSIGDAELVGLWQDPEFDAAQPAFYYARVIEIPTPRWTAYDAAYYGITPPAEAPMTLQERAYTSPIWYSPP